MKRLFKVLGALVALWLVACLVIGYVARGRMRARMTERLGAPLKATTTMDDLDLALVRGHLDLSNLALARDDGGHLSIRVPEVSCDLPPFGWALVDGDCRTLTIKGMRVEVSAATMFQIQTPKQTPVHAGRVVIDDARLEFSPSAFVPGLGRIAITVEHAEARDTVFKTPLSWIFALDHLRAKLELPGDLVVKLVYEDGKLRIGGGLFGSELELPIAIPVAELADDPRAELAKLAELGKTVADAAATKVEQRAKDWIKSKL